MLGLSPSTLQWLGVLFLCAVFLLVWKIVYNLFFHPLRDVPGPFWARATGLPSWYHTTTGRRHIWLWQLFEIYGDRIRPEPNKVLFRDPEAYTEIYGAKANTRRSRFYTAFKLNDKDSSILITVDVAEHAAKRKRMSLAFNEKSLRATADFVVRHVDRWNELMVPEGRNDEDWSESFDMTEKLDGLIFDIMGDLSFGRSFDIKEPGDNPLKAIPHSIVDYMKFYYPMTRSPFVDALIWLKPRGLDKLFEFLSPPSAKYYRKFVDTNLDKQMELQKAHAEKPESERRKDIFYFLHEARDPDTGLPAYSETDLKAESSLLIIAGSDTTGAALSGIFFYLTSDPARCQKLAEEIRTTFRSAEDIVQGPKLLGCTYMKACIDESMRLAPSGLGDMPREVLKGGIRIKRKHYPEGINVGTVPWCDNRDDTIFGPDATMFRPERWIVGEMADDGIVTKESVARLRTSFHPFLIGPGACIGKNVAMAEIMITLARTLHRFDIRRAPGSKVGCGGPELGWGMRDPKQMVLEDAYIAMRKGPEMQVRKRV